jgi:hypothetical protein
MLLLFADQINWNSMKKEKENTHLYIARKIVLVDGSLEVIHRLLLLDQAWPYPAIIFKQDSQSIMNISNIGENFIAIQSIPTNVSYSFLLNIYNNGSFDLFIFDNNSEQKTILYKVFVDRDPLIVRTLNISLIKNKWIWLGSLNLSNGNHKVSILKFTILNNHSIVPTNFNEAIIGFYFSNMLKFKNDTILYFAYVSPSLYVLRTDLKSPFILVLAESFSTNWKIYYGIQNWISMLFSQPVPENFHFIVNGYANGWYVVPRDDFNGLITIYYWEQTILYIGLIISVSSISFGIVYISYDFFVDKYKQTQRKNKKDKYC